MAAGTESQGNTTPGRMHAAVLHGPRDLRIEDRAVPEPGPGEVVAEVSHCGICGTDLHMVVEGWGQPGSVGGHEWSGTVVAVGPDVGSLEVGSQIVGGSLSCRQCAPCRTHRPSLCERRGPVGTGGIGAIDGAFAHYVRAAAHTVVPVPDGLDLRTAALAEPLAVALHAVTLSGVGPGDRVLVTGAGPIGALVVVALVGRGVTDIVVSEPRPERQELARRLGASVVEPGSLEIITIVEPHRIVDEPFDAVIECSGKSVAMDAGLCQLRRGGTLVLVGTGIDGPHFDPNRILLNELIVTGAFEYDEDGIEEALSLLAGGLDVSPLLTDDDVPLAGLLRAMEDLADGRRTGKVLVSPTLTRPTPSEAP